MKTLTTKKKKLMSMSNRDIHEIEGIRGMYNIIPLYVIREFKWNSNFMYCLDYKSGKIICERKFSDYENIRKDKRTYRVKRREKQIQQVTKQIKVNGPQLLTQQLHIVGIMVIVIQVQILLLLMLVLVHQMVMILMLNALLHTKVKLHIVHLLLNIMVNLLNLKVL